jgi:hypothetical protein
VDGDVEVGSEPFVKFLVNEARNEDGKEWNDGNQNICHIVSLAFGLALQDSVGIIQAPEYLHVLEPLPLMLNILIDGGHVVKKREID